MARGKKEGKEAYRLENARDISMECNVWILFGCWFEQTKSKKKSWANQGNLSAAWIFYNINKLLGLFFRCDEGIVIVLKKKREIDLIS